MCLRCYPGQSPCIPPGVPVTLVCVCTAPGAPWDCNMHNLSYCTWLSCFFLRLSYHHSQDSEGRPRVPRAPGKSAPSWPSHLHRSVKGGRQNSVCSRQPPHHLSSHNIYDSAIRVCLETTSISHCAFFPTHVLPHKKPKTSSVSFIPWTLSPTGSVPSFF